LSTQNFVHATDYRKTLSLRASAHTGVAIRFSERHAKTYIVYVKGLLRSYAEKDPRQKTTFTAEARSGKLDRWGREILSQDK